MKTHNVYHTFIKKCIFLVVDKILIMYLKNRFIKVAYVLPYQFNNLYRY